MKAPTVLLLLALSGSLTASSVSAAEYSLSRRSGFASSEVKRNPFWPIGYTHQVKNVAVAAKAKPAISLSAAAFTVSSILISSGMPLAVINGREFAVGDSIEVNGASARVQEIRDGEVVIGYLDQSL